MYLSACILMERHYKLKRLTPGAGYLTVPALMEKKLQNYEKNRMY